MPRLLVSYGLLALALFGCGDDDDFASVVHADASSARDAATGPRSAQDAGAADAGSDAGTDAGVLPRCPEGDCDLLDPLDCGSGQGCGFARSDAGLAAAPQCLPVGSGAEGSACVRSSDCAAGMDCSAFDGTGRCRRYCCALSHTEGCPDGQFCRLGLQAGASDSHVGLCEACDGCDPRVATACDHGLACYPLPGSRECTACLPPGKGKPRNACTLSTDCERGSACFRLEGQGSRCVAFCDLEGDKQCADSTRTCQPATGGKLPSGLGLCL